MFSTETVNPNNKWMRNFPFFNFAGDCYDPNTHIEVKDNFLNLVNGGYVPPIFCNLKCNTNTVQVSCGDVTAEKRRRKRTAVKLV